MRDNEHSGEPLWSAANATKFAAVPRPVLATDLDGTLIPSTAIATTQRDRQALRELHEAIEQEWIELIFVTGRFVASILEAIDEFQLPSPNWIIGDVGSSIYRATDQHTGQYELVMSYRQHLDSICRAEELAAMHQRFSHELPIERQEEENQGSHKLSYYCDENHLDSIVEQMETIIQREQQPLSMVHSVDPDDGRGLIDVMPRGVNKAYALQWWSDHLGHDRSRMVYAGDSGNDLAALTSGIRGIVVGNASRDLRLKLDRQAKHLIDQGLIYFSQNGYTSGVVEGARHHRLLPAADVSGNV